MSTYDLQATGYHNDRDCVMSPTPINNPTPPDYSKTKIRRIVITQVDRGYMVEVGCQTIVIERDTELITLLSTYILQPASTEQRYMDGKLF